ncbi:MAG: hypothetical protein K5745_04805 [Saccharofermentans sp.]|nr:hypothetical protein [Saccharofermentans sp.]
MIKSKVYWHKPEVVEPEDERPVDTAVMTPEEGLAPMTMRYMKEGRDYRFPLSIGGYKERTSVWTGFFLPYVFGTKAMVMEMPGVAYWTDRIEFGKESRKLSDSDAETAIKWFETTEKLPEGMDVVLVVTRDAAGDYVTRPAIYLPKDYPAEFLDRERSEVIEAVTQEPGFFEYFRQPGRVPMFIHIPDVIYWCDRTVPSEESEEEIVIDTEEEG